MSDAVATGAVMERAASTAPWRFAWSTERETALRHGLAAIAERRQFCLWRLEPNPTRPEKPRKVPYVRGGRLVGSYGDPVLPPKLFTLDEALALAARSHCGVGLVFTPGCGAGAADLDGCVEGGRTTFSEPQRATARLLQPHAFIERSVSGTGLHMIVCADTSTLKANGAVEWFGDRNFLALTGDGRGVARPCGAEVARAVLAEVEKLRTGTKEQRAPEPLVAPVRARLDVSRELNLGDSECDPKRARAALEHLDPRSFAHRDQYRALACAFHAAAGADAFDAFDAWSAGDPDKYNRDGNLAIWQGIKEAGGITAATLYHYASAAGWKPAGRPPQPSSHESANALGDGDDEAATSPTDLALSHCFVRMCGDLHKYDHARQAWVNYAEGAFVVSGKGQEVEAFKGLAASLTHLAAEAVKTDPDSSITKRKLECARRAQSANGIRNALSLAKSDRRVAVTFTEFDRDPDLFNVANGVIHLPSGEPRPHDPALKLHRQSPVPYQPDAKCPEFLDFLMQAACGDAEWVDYMQRSLGYALSGYVTEERAQFWLGNGANGKSVLANLCRHVFGTYAASAPSAFLMQSRRDAGGATPELAMLPGVRLLMANEVEAGSRLSAQTLKVAVSTEHIAARPLYGNVFSFRPTHKLIVRGNHRPIIPDDDEGIWRRIDLVPFELNLKPDQRDQGLEARLIAEAPGILRWMVEGFAKWRRDGLRQPRRVRDASLAYRKDSDVLGQWLDDVCDAGQGYEMPQAAAYAGFRLWCHDQGLRQVSKKSFTRGLKERGVGERRESTGQRKELYTGIRLKG